MITVYLVMLCIADGSATCGLPAAAAWFSDSEQTKQAQQRHFGDGDVAAGNIISSAASA